MHNTMEHMVDLLQHFYFIVNVFLKKCFLVYKVY